MEQQTHRSQVEAKISYDLQEELLAEMRLTVKTLVSAVEAYFGIPIVRHRLFQMLFPGQERSQAEIQRRLDVDGAVVTRLVKQLEGEGLLTRRPDPADNRFTLVALTPQAETLIEEMLVKRRGVEAILMQGVNPEDVDCVKRVLARIRQNAGSLSAARSAGSPSPISGETTLSGAVDPRAG